VADTSATKATAVATASTATVSEGYGIGWD
jgi:hypothetical protein